MTPKEKIEEMEKEVSLTSSFLKINLQNSLKNYKEGYEDGKNENKEGIKIYEEYCKDRIIEERNRIRALIEKRIEYLKEAFEGPDLKVSRIELLDNNIFELEEILEEIGK